MTRGYLQKRFFQVTIFIFVILLLISYTPPYRGQLSEIEQSTKDALAPLQSGVMAVSRQVNAYISSLFAFRAVKIENDYLKHKVAKLESNNNESIELRDENQRLRQLLKFQAETVGKLDLAVAAVIARDSSNWYNSLTINKGFKDGLAVNMAVMTEKGLVGHITSVSDRTAEVLLILDSRSALGGLIQETRIPGVIEGDEKEFLRLIHLPRDVVINEGSTVITSGLGGIFPKGIRIGKITGVATEPNGLLRYAVIKPFVDFDRLEEVLIVKSGQLP